MLEEERVTFRVTFKNLMGGRRVVSWDEKKSASKRLPLLEEPANEDPEYTIIREAVMKSVNRASIHYTPRYDQIILAKCPFDRHQLRGSDRSVMISFEHTKDVGPMKAGPFTLARTFVQQLDNSKTALAVSLESKFQIKDYVIVSPEHFVEKFAPHKWH